MARRIRRLQIFIRTLLTHVTSFTELKQKWKHGVFIKFSLFSRLKTLIILQISNIQSGLISWKIKLIVSTITRQVIFLSPNNNTTYKINKWPAQKEKDKKRLKWIVSIREELPAFHIYHVDKNPSKNAHCHKRNKLTNREISCIHGITIIQTLEELWTRVNVTPVVDLDYNQRAKYKTPNRPCQTPGQTRRSIPEIFTTAWRTFFLAQIIPNQSQVIRLHWMRIH